MSSPIEPKSSRHMAVMFPLALAFATVVFDSSVLSVALADIQSSLHGTLTWLQWVANSYVLMFASFILMTGKLADRFGARNTLLGGVAGFSCASLLCGLAPSLGWLVAFRVLQGFFAASVANSSFALAAHTFPAGHSRSKALAQMNFCGSLGLLLGPILGGVLVQWLSWRWIFFPNALIGVVIVFFLTRIENPSEKQLRGLDLAGQMLGVIALAGLAIALVESNALGWTSPVVIGAAVAFVFATVLFFRVETRAAVPMLPLSIFRHRSFSIGTYCGWCWGFSLYGLMFLMGLYFEHNRGYSSGLTGIAFVPIMAGSITANLASIQLMRRYGEAAVCKFGFVVAAAGAGFVAITGASAAYTYIAIGFALVGLGGGLAMPSNGAIVFHDVDKESLGIASGIYNAGRQVGVLTGISVLGSLGDRHGATPLIAGMAIAAVVLASAALVGARYRPGSRVRV